MFDTNDVFNDAVRGSTLHVDDNSSVESSIGSKVVAMLLLTGITYVGFNYYASMSNVDKTLVVKNELVAEIQVESESLVETKLETMAQLSNSEANYLSALREIESELTEEREYVNLDTSKQLNLSSAMTDILEDEVVSKNTNYTNALRKEIGVEVNKVEKSFSSSVMSEFDDTMVTTNLNEDKELNGLSLTISELMDDKETDVEVNTLRLNESKDTRTVVVKKGDTLQGISNKFYGDAMNYKRIIASNDSLISNDTIYVGQTILLPY